MLSLKRSVIDLMSHPESVELLQVFWRSARLSALDAAEQGEHSSWSIATICYQCMDILVMSNAGAPGKV